MTPERLTWTPDDGPDALLAIRDRVKAAEDANVPMEPMTVRVGGAVITDSPCTDEDDLVLVVPWFYVTVYGEPSTGLTRVEWTPPADPGPAWARHRGDSMSDYPSDLGHWERISESASAVNYGRELNMHTVVEDVCRALIDLNHRLNQVKADAWDEGHEAGQHNEHEHRPGRKITNPYREDSHD